MTRPLLLRVTRRAAAEIQDAAEWWYRNRPAAPDAVAEELERAFALITAQPNVGAIARNPRLAGVRRVHLARIRYHLYYRVSRAQVEVLALWHTSRGSAPKL